MTKNITELGKREVEFLSSLASSGREIFTIKEARAYWRTPELTRKRLAHLEAKGWLARLERGKYLIVPLEAGPERTWSENAFVVAASLLQPSAISYWSALSHWHMTDQVPRVVFVQSPSRKFKREVTVLGVTYRFVTVVERKFFGLKKESTDHKVYWVTDREKTILDCLDRPDLAGGLGEVAAALRTSAPELDWDRMETHAARLGVGAILKRLGFLVDALMIEISDREERLSRWSQALTSGISELDPSSPRQAERIDTRWRVWVNVDERALRSTAR